MKTASRRYYYFISSLPDLALDDYKDPMRLEDFSKQLDEVLEGSHKSYVADILAVRDNLSLLDVVLGEDYKAASGHGLTAKENLNRMVEDEEWPAPRHIREFIFSFKEAAKNGAPLNRRQAYDLLMYCYYYRMLRHENAFIREYFSFDLDLRNVLAALNARKSGSKEDFFVRADGDLITLKLKDSTFSDFGLSGELDYVGRLVEVFEHGDFVATEKYVDMLRWRKIDEINTFFYFDIEVILGFLLKLMMCERWLHLEPKKGHEAFEKLVQAKY
ncbi:MAG: DUF2764 family protein [Candidatus Omnitrophota bacterium]